MVEREWNTMRLDVAKLWIVQNRVIIFVLERKTIAGLSVLCQLNDALHTTIVTSPRDAEYSRITLLSSLSSSSIRIPNAGRHNTAVLMSDNNSNNDAGLAERLRQVVEDGGDLGRLQLLLEEEDMNVNAKTTKGGWTALHRACGENLLEVVRFLVANGADVNLHSNVNQWTPLHQASWNGLLPLATLLIELGASLHAKDEDGWASLHMACRNGHLEVAKLLLENGADIDVKDKNGLTPLHWAHYIVKSEVVRFLIENGADVNSKNKDGETPLHWGFYKDLDTSWHHIRYGFGRGRMEAIKLLIENGADVNAKNNKGRTALHSICLCGHLESAQLLVETNAIDVNVPDDNGKLPLHLACQNGHWKVVQVLLSRGVNTTQASNDGSTPLQIACQETHRDIVWLLVRHHPSLLVVVEPLE